MYSADVFELKGVHYLTIIDYFSSYIFVRVIQSLNSTRSINVFNQIFREFGLPDILMTDNVTNLMSAEFAQYMEKFQFKHITSSPNYPKANEHAERSVRTIKVILEKCIEDSHNMSLTLLNYRCKPMVDTGKSLIEVFIGRCVNCTILCMPTQMLATEDMKIMLLMTESHLVRMIWYGVKNA